MLFRGDMMGFLDKVFTKKTEDADVEDFLNTLDVEEEAMVEDADAYVKPINLVQDSDVQAVVSEMKKGNLILLGIGDLSKRNAIKLRELITMIKEEATRINGDIARISSDRVLITPSRVKIVKKRAQ